MPLPRWRAQPWPNWPMTTVAISITTMKMTAARGESFEGPSLRMMRPIVFDRRYLRSSDEAAGPETTQLQSFWG